jgi:hypothetical protein
MNLSPPVQNICPKQEALPWNLNDLWDPLFNGHGTTFVGFRITGILDFVHRPEFEILENTMFRKLDLFPSSGEGNEVIEVSSF